MRGVSASADRVVRAFMRLLGEKRAPWALMGSGYVLAIPVFFDTVFYLLVPLARSFFRRTGRNYLLCLVAIAAGGGMIECSPQPRTPNGCKGLGDSRITVSIIGISSVVGMR